jgi:hypothetical protein
MTEPLLSPKRAAAFLDIHYKTFLDLARREGLKPDGAIGTRKRYDPKTLRLFAKTLQLRNEAKRTSRHLKLVLRESLQQRGAAS